ncbi:MAG: hypothetical protein K8T91_04390 [Planctomycetes bacterium]|nr:hypothetical protein [Planctomycetota bacterium]
MISYYLFCPLCGVRVDLPDDEMEDLWKVTCCDDCGASFSYDPEKIQQGDDTPPDVTDS